MPKLRVRSYLLIYLILKIRRIVVGDHHLIMEALPRGGLRNINLYRVLGSLFTAEFPELQSEVMCIFPFYRLGN